MKATKRESVYNNLLNEYNDVCRLLDWIIETDFDAERIQDLGDRKLYLMHEIDLCRLMWYGESLFADDYAEVML